MLSYVMKRCKERKVKVMVLLKASNSRISISIDVWTSNNYMSFLGVVAHFVGKLVDLGLARPLIGRTFATPN
jgi:hypothetical protein